MAKSLTTLISDVQTMLLDDGTRFSTATCTAAVRAALKDFNRAAPTHAGTLVDVVSGQKEYVLNSSDFKNLINVSSVLKQGTDTHLENNTPLLYDFYFEDNVPIIRLRTGQTSGYLIVRYTIPHTVSGLDSETESTIPAYFEPTLIDGACYWACTIRMAGRIEPINLNNNVVKMLEQTKTFFKAAFDTGLMQAARRAPQASGEQVFAWNDEWYNQQG